MSNLFLECTSSCSKDEKCLMEKGRCPYAAMYSARVIARQDPKDPIHKYEQGRYEV